MRSYITTLLVFSLTVVVASISLTYRPAQAQSLVLYDAFNGPLIDPARWVGAEEIDPALPPPQGAVEISRSIVGGQLVMSHRLYSNPVDESENFHALSLRVRNPTTVATTALKATVIIKAYQLQACAGRFARVLTRVSGAFFNAGTPEPGKFTDDVAARIEVFRNTDSVDAPDVLRVRARARRCVDEACNTAEILNLDLGTVRIGHLITATVRWDKANRRFLFRRDANPEVQIVYPWSDDAAPAMPGKALAFSSSVSNCTTGTGVAFITTAFDNVFVNP